MYLLLIIAFLYFLLIIALIIGFNKVSTFLVKNESTNQTFSIVIPFRNEAQNIRDLATSLNNIQYSKEHFEVLFINDASTDNSVPLLTEFIIQNKNWKLLDNERKSNSPKKDAIYTAIKNAKFDWILTTDADCEVSENWLKAYNSFIINNQSIQMIAGPVTYKTNASFLQNFQNMDFLSLIGATIGAFGINKPFLCNGANLCYHKKAFFAVNGFEGNDTIASGDDVFLLEKMIATYPTDVMYLKSNEALVITKPETTFKGLLNQRIRWASKTSATSNWFGKITGILILLMNLCIIYGFILLREASCFQIVTSAFLPIFILKISLDYVLIQKTTRFFQANKKIKFYLLSAIFYPFFVVFVIFSTFFKKYDWKGRQFKK